MARILVVDDETHILESIDMFLSEKGHTVETASTAEQGMTLFMKKSMDVVILDIRLPDGSGLDLLSSMQAANASARIIMITAFQDMESTIEAMKRGAYDYLHKPLDAHELEKTLDDALFHIQADKGYAQGSDPERTYDNQAIIGRSREMKDIFKTIGVLCKNKAPALIQGETGTGKELIARRIHLAGNSDEPFITFDCSAVVGTLLESELFGHEKGSFTGAVSAKPGKIELAGQGTLFLDEIGELPLNLQGKFLGFLERKEFMRVGDSRVRSSRCRIVAATNRDLQAMVRQKRFRSDLYYRLKVVSITVPPLRKRLDDIPDLVDHFLRKSSRNLGTDLLRLQEGCVELLKAHPWTGNVRELENVLVAAAVRSRGRVILKEDIHDLLSSVGIPEKEDTRTCSLADVECRHILNILNLVGWNRTQAARILGISLPTLRKKIKDHAIARKESF
ncbi:MAG: sigma-54 dependent transcriptional regulator [Pseudomonadota bacterium]